MDKSLLNYIAMYWSQTMIYVQIFARDWAKDHGDKPFDISYFIATLHSDREAPNTTELIAQSLWALGYNLVLIEPEDSHFE